MSRRLLLTSVVASAFAGAGVGLGQEAGARAPAGLRGASCVVQIASDHRAVPIDAKLVEFLLDSTPVADAAVREVLGANAPDRRRGIDIVFQPIASDTVAKGLAPPSSTTLRVVAASILVIVDEPLPPVAAELLNCVVKRLEAAVRAADAGEADVLRSRLAAVEAELAAVEQRFARIRTVQQELTEKAGQSDLSRARIENTVRDLEQMKASLELKLAGSKAREAALTDQLARVHKSVEAALQQSEVAAELQKIVEIREREVARIRDLVNERGSSPQQLDKALEALAQARAELAHYREQASQNQGGGVLADLNRQLIDLNVEAVETEAQLRAIQGRLADMRARGLLDLAELYEREVEMERSFAEQALRDLMSERERLTRQLRELRPPELRVIGGQ